MIWLLIPAALLLLWLFLIAPHARKKAMCPFLRPYAHRGLWGGEVPENSLQAFDRAAAQGFARGVCGFGAHKDNRQLAGGCPLQYMASVKRYFGCAKFRFDAQYGKLRSVGVFRCKHNSSFLLAHATRIRSSCRVKSGIYLCCR